jgi:hypothetical protein
MRKIPYVLFIIAMSFSLAACGAAQNKYPEMILTKEQMLSDYDAMWSAMEENYPFWGVIDRRNGEGSSYLEGIQAYRNRIESMELTGDKAMFEYIDIIAGSLYEITGDPHVSILNPNRFRSDRDAYKAAVGEMPEAQPWVDALESPQADKLYQYYDYLLQMLPEEQQDEPASEEAAKAQATREAEPARLKETNLTTEILEEGKIAYIKVASFDDAFIEGDVPRILAFLEEVKNYEHLIIDIAENGGGNSVYWEEAFARPNLSEPVSVSDVRMMQNTEIALRYYGTSYQGSTLTVDAARTNPRFTELSTEDLANLTLARELTYTLEPAGAEKLFRGQIWVLTGPAIYSSAESFVAFCKSSGFATLVGETTGGGNTGGPVYYELPVSHILIQFDVEYCLNQDGSCSQETGTSPDIESANALQTTLDAIHAKTS